MPSESDASLRLRRAVKKAEPLLRTITETDSARHPAPGKWSHRQSIDHLELHLRQILGAKWSPTDSA